MPRAGVQCPVFQTHPGLIRHSLCFLVLPSVLYIRAADIDLFVIDYVVAFY